MTTGDDATDKAKDAARTVRRSPVLRRTARAGFAVLGLLHVVIGATAISVAVRGGSGGAKADQTGAMEQIRQSAVGGLVLGAIAVALLALAVWQIADAFLTRAPKGTTTWGRRLKGLGIAVVYLALATTALVFAVGGRTDSSRTSQTLSSRILSAPGGVFLLVVVGLSVIAIGVGFAFGAVTRSFTRELTLPSGAARIGILAFGTVGYAAKGIAVGATGVFVVVAALTHDPQKAAGLDAALRSLAGLPFGRALLYAVGAGLIVYGLFCVVRARYARM
ncbi:DUF1206 domain-containing protein [uncultured Microbacterium sp.]|uniref:DUF1206 domain-containing protein n=1 Tax=uncultured Microbacterium sp. TaxID=191216 RepID=UPI0025CF2C11|nr:DUF1206 domain-containing protein [uncultured Microbacterium sp.]